MGNIYSLWPKAVVVPRELSVMSIGCSQTLIPSYLQKPFVVPEIYARDCIDCRFHVGAAALFESGKLVEETRYLHRNDPSYPSTSEPIQLDFPGRHPFVGFNREPGNYYHSLVQMFFSIFVILECDTRANKLFLLSSAGEKFKPLLTLLALTEKDTVWLDTRSVIQIQKTTIVNAAYGFAYTPSPLLRKFGHMLLTKSDATDSACRSIYISRRDSTNRVLQNEDMLEQMLKERGFVPVVLSDLTLGEQAAIFRGAERIVAPHGAGLSNLIFCRPGTKVLELMPSSYVNGCFLRIGQACDLDYSVLVVAAGSAEVQQKITWTVDVTAVQNLLDEVGF